MHAHVDSAMADPTVAHRDACLHSGSINMDDPMANFLLNLDCMEEDASDLLYQISDEHTIEANGPDEFVDENEDTDVQARSYAIERLELFALSVIAQLSAAVSTTMHMSPKRKANHKIILHLANRRDDAQTPTTTRAVKFPQRTKGPSSRPLAQILKVVDLMHEALRSGIPTTKRDIYYKDVQLFKSQAVVNRLVDDIAATLELRRADLHVRASPKGMITGSKFSIKLVGGDVIEINDTEGTLIPVAEDISSFEMDESLAWILVVEKEAVFQTLCRFKFSSLPVLPGHGLIITGKGYPDMATSQLVKTLSDNLPCRSVALLRSLAVNRDQYCSIPILALVDADAYGIDILSVYKFGSSSMSHEHENLAAIRVEMIGVYSTEMAELGLSKDTLLPITKHDERKALAMLRHKTLPAEWRKELQYMLHNRRKAEIEILSDSLAYGDFSTPGDDRRFSRTQASQFDQMSSLVQYLVRKISFAVNAAKCF